VAALFCYIDRHMGSAQWADIGMYLQTIMLLLRGKGLHSCPQKAWPVYHRTAAEILSPPNEFMLVCGMSIGFEEGSANYALIDRAPLEETVTFVN
jgi:nitroreductase